MKRIAFSALLASALVAAPAFAAPTIGMVVVNPNSMTVGKVVAVSADGTQVTVRTKKHDHVLAAASLEEGKNRLIYSKTSFQLDAEFEAAAAAAAAADMKLKTALDVGKPVLGADGKEVGTIAMIDAEVVSIKIATGQEIRLPRTGIGATAEGAMIGWTSAQFADVVAQASAK